MNRRTKMIGMLIGASAAAGLAGCSTVELEMSGPRSYLIEPSGYGLGPGPSLVAGDQLAYRMVLAGAYDAPSVFEGTGFATVPTNED